MSSDSLFQITSMMALVGWLLLLLVSPFVTGIDKIIIGIIITLLALVYAWLIFSAFHPGDMKKFGTLDGVIELFQNKTLVTAGWIHYLAFDLLTGTWIKQNSMKYGFNHWIIVPCLLLTFMLGPVGLLLYLLLRFFKTKNYFATNY